MKPQLFRPHFVSRAVKSGDTGISVVKIHLQLQLLSGNKDSFEKNTKKNGMLANVANRQLPTAKPKLLGSGTVKSDFLTIRAASKRFNIKPEKLRELCLKEMLVSSGKGNKLRISLDSLRDYLKPGGEE